MVRSAKSLLALKDDEKSTFIISIVLYTLVLLPILVADRYNLDDWDRSAIGYVNWGQNGRPLTDVIVSILGLGKPLVDFSPICQIGAIICLSWLSAVVARKFDIRRPLVASLATLPFGANPFFLANLSFKFDSLPMSLSILFALLPIVFDEALDGPYHRSLLSGSVLLLGSLCLYQPGINGFIVVAVFEYLILQKRNEPSAVIMSLVRRRILQLLIALCVYTIVAHYTVREGYGAEHASMVIGIGGFATVQRNLVYFWTFPIDLLTGRLRFALVLPVVSALLLAVAVGLQYSARMVKFGKFVWVSVAFATPIFMLFGTFGFLIFLQSPVAGPRTFIGFGALLASSLILISSVLADFDVPGVWQCSILFIPAYTMITFSAIFANATKAQKDYEKHIADVVSDDLKEVIAVEPVENLIIDGNVGFAPLVRRVVEKRYRLLSYLVPIDLSSDETGGFVHTVLGNRGISVPAETSKARRASVVAKTVDSVPLRSDPYCKMFLVTHDLVVRLISSTR